MCECGGTGVVEEYSYAVGMREVPCPDDDCAYWDGE